MAHRFACSACAFEGQSGDDELVEIIRAHTDEKHGTKISVADDRDGWDEVWIRAATEKLRRDSTSLGRWSRSVGSQKPTRTGADGPKNRRSSHTTSDAEVSSVTSVAVSMRWISPTRSASWGKV